MFFKKAVIFALILSLAACGNTVHHGTPTSPRIDTGTMSAPPKKIIRPITRTRVGGGDIADAATTAIGLSRGFVEGNPLLSDAGSAAPIAAIAGKLIMKKVLVATGSSPTEANIIVETGGWVASCANIATISAGVKPEVAISLGLVCGVVARKILKAKAKKLEGQL